jgi:tRNA dimethylallyltransferase
MSAIDRAKVIVITGPTATGKTALGALFARESAGEVVSADSMQVYRHMDIGTAKATAEEMLGVPHHMLGIVSPQDDYSVARYVSDASQCISGILSRGRLPVIVGGTGLYIDSLLSGCDFSPRDSGCLRTELEAEYDCIGGESMLREMAAFDPESANKLHSNDRKRIVRAFEIYRASGKTITQHDKETKCLPSRYDATKFALTFSDRSHLYARIDDRVDAMLAAGLEREAKLMLDMGIPPNSTAMQAIGYKEIAEAIFGKLSMDAAVGMIKQRSRNYAKRQLTWLRRDETIHWIAWHEAPDLDLGISVIRGFGNRE